MRFAGKAKGDPLVERVLLGEWQSHCLVSVRLHRPVRKPHPIRFLRRFQLRLVTCPGCFFHLGWICHPANPVSYLFPIRIRCAVGFVRSVRYLGWSFRPGRIFHRVRLRPLRLFRFGIAASREGPGPMAHTGSLERSVSSVTAELGLCGTIGNPFGTRSVRCQRPQATVATFKSTPDTTVT